MPVFLENFLFFFFFFFFWHSVTLSRSCNPKRVNLVKQKAQETVLTRFQIVFYLNIYLCKQTKGKKKKLFFVRCCRLVSYPQSSVQMPVQRGGLQVREEEQSRFLSVFWNHTSLRFTAPQHVDQCPGQTRLQSRSRCLRREERQKGMLPLPCHPFRVTVPNFCFHTFCKYSFELFGSVVFIIIIFPTLRKWLQKNTDQDRLFYFTFSYFFFPFPIEPKGNPILNHLPPPTHSFFYSKLKMAIPYYSHNGRDSVCVWLCVICLLFFF